MQELAGKVAVVTGAGSGIGRALARRLSAEGMRVALADVLVQPTDVRLADDVGALADRAAQLATGALPERGDFT